MAFREVNSVCGSVADAPSATSESTSLPASGGSVVLRPLATPRPATALTTTVKPCACLRRNFRESRMREIRPSGLTRGEAAAPPLSYSPVSFFALWKLSAHESTPSLPLVPGVDCRRVKPLFPATICFSPRGVNFRALVAPQNIKKPRAFRKGAKAQRVPLENHAKTPRNSQGAEKGHGLFRAAYISFSLELLSVPRFIVSQSNPKTKNLICDL